MIDNLTPRLALAGLCTLVLLTACATVDRSVKALPSKTASAATVTASSSPTTAMATTNSTAATTALATTVTPTTVAQTAVAPPTTPVPSTTPAPTTTPGPTTTLPPPTTPAPSTTTLPPTTTIAKLAAPSVPLLPLKPGAVGEEVKVLQNRLLDLGFWIDAADGEYGWLTQQAVMAFQKTYVGTFKTATSGTADAATVAAMTMVDTRVSGTITAGDVVEVDKGRQVLFLIRGGKTLWALNTSTGSGLEYTEVNQKQGGNISDVAITPEGTFKVYNEYTKGWEKGQLGELYRPKYFKGGVAVHGSNSIPNYPASHGCVRITTTAMDWIWDNELLPIGTTVVVHG